MKQKDNMKIYNFIKITDKIELEKKNCIVFFFFFDTNVNQLVIVSD